MDAYLPAVGVSSCFALELFQLTPHRIPIMGKSILNYCHIILQTLLLKHYQSVTEKEEHMKHRYMKIYGLSETNLGPSLYSACT